SEEHTSELQSLAYLVCRLLLEKKNRDRGRVRRPGDRAQTSRRRCRRQQADWFRCADSCFGGRYSEGVPRFDGQGPDTAGEIQRALREVWQLEPTAWMGTRASN